MWAVGGGRWWWQWKGHAKELEKELGAALQSFVKLDWKKHYIKLPRVPDELVHQAICMAYPGEDHSSLKRQDKLLRIWQNTIKVGTVARSLAHNKQHMKQ